MTEDYETASRNSSSLQSALKETELKFTKELMTLRLEIKMNHKEIVDLKQQLKEYEESDRKIEEEFGISLDKIIKEYREIIKKQQVCPIKSNRSITRYK